MTQGDVMGGLLAFSVPALIGNLLHQVYSLTDSIVVGRILGMEALAAVGCTLPIILLLASLMIGTNIGVGVLLSQAFGAHDMLRMRRGFLNSLYVGVGISLTLALLGAPLSKPILRLMGTPEGPLQNAASYLRISFITSLCPMLYYLFSCAFRGMGDSRTDLYCLIVSVAMNVALDILFVAVFRWGVAGSAWATALAQLTSAVFAACLLFKKYPVMRPERADLRPDGSFHLSGALTAVWKGLAAHAGKNNPPVLHFSPEKIHLSQEVRHKLVGRLVIDFIRRTALLDHTPVDQENPVAHGHGFGLVMGHIDDGDARLPLDLLDSRSSFGAATRALARATRCCWPPESWLGSRSAYWLRWTVSRTFPTARSICSFVCFWIRRG